MADNTNIVDDMALQATPTSGQTPVTSEPVNEAPSTDATEQELSELRNLGYFSPDQLEVDAFREERAEPTVITSKEAIEDAEKNIADTQEDVTTIEDATAKAEEREMAPVVAEPAPEPVWITEENTDGTVTIYKDGKPFTSNTAVYAEQFIQDKNLELEVDEELEQQIKDNEEALDKATASLDALNQSMVENIKATYELRKNQMKELNKRTLEGLRLVGIKTGRQRYAGAIERGLLSSEEAAGIQRLAQLDAEEKTLIAEAQIAITKEQITALQEKRARLDAVRLERMETIREQQKLAEERNQELLDRLRKVSQDSAIASLVKQGITNVGAIHNLINYNEKGELVGDATLEEVGESLETLLANPSLDAITKIYQSALNSGAPRSVLDAILQSPSPADAYKIAGGYAQNATGIVGEYNRYRIDSLERGITPLSFNDYQTMDANRKAKADAMANGLPSSIVTQIDKLSRNFDISPIVKNFNEVANKKMAFDGIIASGIKGPADLAMVFDFMKALDPESVVRESEYKSAAESGNIFKGWAARFNGYMNEGGGFLPDRVREDFQSIVDIKFDAINRQYSNLKSETARKIEMKTSTYDSKTPGEDYLTNYETVINQHQIMQNEQDAETQIVNALTTNPELETTITTLMSADPEITYAKVLEYLQLKGLIN